MSTLLRYSLEIARPVMPILRRALGIRVRQHSRFRVEVEDGHGLEIGGPSGIFRDAGALPLYRYVGALDNCVFAEQTIWDNRGEGATFSFHPRKPNGINFIKDATDLSGIATGTYDFLLSSHALEHIANPIRALKEWMRVAKPGAAFIVVLPNYRRTFDHRRQPTSIAHMVADYASGVTEADTTHLPEVLALHDFKRNPDCKNQAEFRERATNNLAYRAIHHHVFDEHNSAGLLEAAGLSVSAVGTVRPNHIVLLAKRYEP